MNKSTIITSFVMCRLVISRMVSVLPILALLVSNSASAQQPSAQLLPSNPDKAQRARWIREYSNWGRWGKNDELGTLNLITNAKRQKALSLAKSGVVVSLARKVWLVERNPANPAARPGSFFEMDLYPGSAVEVGSADNFIFDMQEYAVHGSFVTHIDSLCHLSYEGSIYNGYSYKETVSPAGCSKAGIGNVKGGIVTRGVLIDMPRLRGVASLAPDDKLRPEDVAKWEKQTGLKISAGDAVLLYTGQKDTQPTGQVVIPEPGTLPIFPKYDTSMVGFFKARDVAVVGLDNVVADAQYIITALGAYALNNLDLNELAETAVRLNRWEFMLTVAPIATPGATGSVVNPLAIF